jgi:hypothetical protein
MSHQVDFYCRERRLTGIDCKKFGKFRPKFHGEAKSLGHAFELIANENTVLLLLASARHLSPAGGREDITTSWLRD